MDPTDSWRVQGFQARIQGAGQGGQGRPGGREVPQLIEGSETYQPEVKASKSDKRLRSYGHLKKTIHFHVFWN